MAEDSAAPDPDEDVEREADEEPPASDAPDQIPDDADPDPDPDPDSDPEPGADAAPDPTPTPDTAGPEDGSGDGDDDGGESATADGPDGAAGDTDDGEWTPDAPDPVIDAEADTADDTDDAATPTSDGGETIPPYQSIEDFEMPGPDRQEGPAEDEEMPLTVHIEEMLKRLAVVIAVAGVVSIVAFPYADQVLNFLWNSILPQGPTTRPRLYGILELKLTELKLASLAGLIIALPVLVYQTYKFMRPGLYPHERRYYLAAVPTSLVLALVGVSFAYFLFLPLLFGYFLGYSREVAQIGFALGKTFDLILLMMGYLAVVFQIPLFIMLAMMMGLVTREWLAERRLIFWGAFLGLAFFIGVGDPTGAAPFLVAVTMVLLFEGTLLLAKWTDRGSRADWA